MLVLHAFGIAAVTLATLLALWQHDAWQSGRALAARDLAGGRPVPLDAVLGPDDAYPNDQVGRPVRFSGEWLPEGTVEVTDRVLDGRDGRWVVTPVAVCDGGCAGAPAVLVVRGWAAAGSDVPPPPSGRTEVTGWLQPGEGRGLPDPDPTDDLLPELRIASAVQHVDTDLYGGYVIARVVSTGSTTGDGLEPVTPDALPEPEASTSLRNLLYAFEWVVFGGFALFLWWRWSRDELDRVVAAERAVEDDDPEGGAGPAGADRDASSAEIASSP